MNIKEACYKLKDYFTNEEEFNKALAFMEEAGKAARKEFEQMNNKDSEKERLELENLRLQNRILAIDLAFKDKQFKKFRDDEVTKMNIDRVMQFNQHITEPKGLPTDEIYKRSTKSVSQLMKEGHPAPSWSTR